MIQSHFMRTDGITRYSSHNVWATSSPGVSNHRRNRPIGALIHSTSGVDSLAWLQGGSEQAGTPASSDALIKSTGERYIITAPDRFAYHAGQSDLNRGVVLKGDQVSALLYGIELEYLDTSTPSWQQYDSLAELIVEKGQLYLWRWPYVLYGHYGVARPLGRRSDPVSFDWGALMGYLFVRARDAGVSGL